MPQNRALELGQRGARLEPQLVGELLPRGAEDVQRVGLPTRPVERQHQLTMERLTERMLRDERLELRHEILVPAEREARFDVELQHA